MNSKFRISSEKTTENINDLIYSAIENELYSKIDEMSKIAIAYAQAFAMGSSENIAKTRAKENYLNIDLDKKVSIELSKSINIELVINKMQNYMKSLFEDYKNNYLDVKTDLRNRFTEYEIDISKIFREVKDRLNFELQNALDIDIQNIEMQTVDIDSTLSFDISIPNSVLDYKYQEAEYETVSDSTWYKPWTWGKTRREKVENEKHTLIINPQDLKKSIEKSMNDTIEIFVGQEKENYKNAIIELRRNNSGIFQDFRLNKQKEIDKLQDDVKDSEKNLKVVEKQLEDFNNLTKE
jgi:hypothetical protein